MSHDKMFSMVLPVIGSGNLQQDRNRTTGADVIGALGRSDPLGAALYRIYADHDPISVRSAARMLADRIRPPRGDERTYLSIALVILQEHVVCACPACNGTGIRASRTGAKRSCGACKGTGKATFGAGERRRALGLTAEEFAPLASVFRRGHAELVAAEYRVGAGMLFQLGRTKRLFGKKVDRATLEM